MDLANESLSQIENVERKIASMILYFVERGGDNLGKTKLMKLLYFSDFGHFRAHNCPISGATYLKWPQGPVPLVAVELLDKWVDWGYANMKRVNVGKTEMFVHSFPDPTLIPTIPLSCEELSTLEKVWVERSSQTTNQIVEDSHRELGWLSSRMNAEIPYHTAMFS